MMSTHPICGKEQAEDMPYVYKSLLGRILATRTDPLGEARNPIKGPYTRVHFRTMEGDSGLIRFAVLERFQYESMLDGHLLKLGFQGIVIRDPADEEILTLHDFHLASDWIRWVMPTPESIDAWIEGASSGARGQLRRKLRSSVGVRVEVAPLTFAEYDRWYESLYRPEILSKSGAIPAWSDVATFARRNGLDLRPPLSEQQVPGISRIFFFDEAGSLIGGVLVATDDAQRMLRIRAAAFEPVARSSRELALRTVAILIEEARAIGFPTLSYGDDPNLFGIDVTVGLAHFKASTGMHPIPSTTGGFQLFKIFDQTHRRLRASDVGKSYLGVCSFAIAGDGAARVRACQHVRQTLDPALSIDRKVAIMRSNSVVLQIGADAGARTIRIPAGMRLLRIPSSC